MMREKKRGRWGHSPAMVALKIVVWLALGAVVVGGVMLLWNWLMPALFTGARTIGYGQALGLIVLCRVLFGGGGRGWKGRRHRHMGKDERDQFRERFKGRCGKQDAPAEEAPQ